MQYIFRGDPAELARGEGFSRTSIDKYGLHFQMGVPVDVSGLTDAQKRKLAGNGHFEVVLGGPEDEPPQGDDADAAEEETRAPRSRNKRK